MKALLLHKAFDLNKESNPLKLTLLPIPQPAKNEILIKVRACGVCHTELDEIEGRTPPLEYPMIPGHQVTGEVAKLGQNATAFNIGDRVGVAWIYSACGKCQYCNHGNENLCSDFVATGRDAYGGYAEYMVVPEKFAYPIPENISYSEAAPLLCAGAVGFRSLKLTNLKNGQNLGLTGFGASGHLVLKMVEYLYPDTDIYVFARSGKERAFALELGAKWSGDSTENPPELLDAIIDTTPVWKPVVEALTCLKPGGRLVINAIRKEDHDKDYLQKMDYTNNLWMEKEVKSVANVTRNDVIEFLDLAAKIPIKPEYQEYSLEQANIALKEIKQRKIRGAKVLVM